MRLSIIVPAYNSARELPGSLAALTASAAPDEEILVVDDASTDTTAAAAAELGARVFRLAANSGPAAAGNHGAGQARGDILVFVDEDVVVARDALSRVRRILDDESGFAAVWGTYDAHPAASSSVSQYRNLLHLFVHREGDPDAATFWAGLGAVRRAAFVAVGGFDVERFARPSIEDIEPGCRLRLDRMLQGTHQKKWTLWSMIRTDTAARAPEVVKSNESVPCKVSHRSRCKSGPKKGLSLETWGRECEGTTPRVARSSATGWEVIDGPRSAWMMSWSANVLPLATLGDQHLGQGRGLLPGQEPADDVRLKMSRST